MLVNRKALAVALVAGAFFAAPSSAWAKWEKLGEKSVGFVADHDIVEVGRSQGWFKRIKLKVHKNFIHLKNIRVIYGNGEVDDIRLDTKIGPGGETNALKLDGPERKIQRIELFYHTKLNFRGKAHVLVYGNKVVD